MMNCLQSVQWSIQNGGYYACGPTLATVPAGAYLCQGDCQGNPYLQPKKLELDDLIDFSGSLSSRILHEIDRFWTLGDRFGQYGFLHRRGYLFYGKQGGGKSSVVHQVVSKIVAAGHVAFFCVHPYYLVACLEKFRQVEPNRPMVCVFEDIDAIIETYGDSQLLQWLDGNFQVDQAVNLATTNFPEKLDRRIIARPRRFDRILRIDAPDAALREAYFLRKVPQLSAAECGRWVRLTEGLPFAALAELVISVCCLDHDVEDAVKLLRELDQHNPSSSEFQNSNGQAASPTPEGQPRQDLAACGNGYTNS
jgi:ATPase family associated with various cellular activities (AAA)